MIKRRGYLVWAHYFNKELSRSEGRRVPTRVAKRNPTAEDLLKAAASLGWEAERLDLRHPAYWWRPGVAVLIKAPEEVRKREVLLRLAERMR
ncbi:MAG: signal recognition particle subunit SRP19/SEC65 family protein [Thaumarchaeota archaeon]|nr:signal recognition particle subunit SRP19/SEC65 family protein [Candidatus Calditenuaceae archaeon]MDW8187599.1 signal recognition particle subunit SRP19/SEC65 family protein [Nitrososphaerota archaeon]